MTFYQKLKNLQDIMGEFPWEKMGSIVSNLISTLLKNNTSRTSKALKQVGLLWKVEQHQYQ